jgi:hypothetical protein
MFTSEQLIKFTNLLGGLFRKPVDEPEYLEIKLEKNDLLILEMKTMDPKLIKSVKNNYAHFINNHKSDYPKILLIDKRLASVKKVTTNSKNVVKPMDKLVLNMEGLKNGDDNGEN